jgi:hypothetical protein
MGSLFPIGPRVLRRLLPARDVARWSRRLSVKVDGAEVLAGEYDFLPAPPRLVTIGRDLIENDQCPAPFGGEVLAVERRLPRD